MAIFYRSFQTLIILFAIAAVLTGCESWRRLPRGNVQLETPYEEPRKGEKVLQNLSIRISYFPSRQFQDVSGKTHFSSPESWYFDILVEIAGISSEEMGKLYAMRESTLADGQCECRLSINDYRFYTAGLYLEGRGSKRLLDRVYQELKIPFSEASAQIYYEAFGYFPHKHAAITIRPEQP